ncbi:MAG: acyl-CoA thioesterase [Oscillatoriales cyanobacterium RM2_1_1]|nr:acyl-CoA thioesterase [Oscillatoriales cyanobacterium SM2_3_0]NJO46014.1 acyl-CoA thioesterase [Oscillatoriales cyanobacterium RM2_1_1]
MASNSSENSSENISFVEGWFEYPVHTFPHQTDYAGIVWHGTYLTWMEEARVAGLRWSGIAYCDLVAAGYDLPVVDLQIRYHQPVTLGMDALVRARLRQTSGVRLSWEYSIESGAPRTKCVTAQVTLVPVNRQTGKIIRQIPQDLQAALDQFWS